MLAGCTALALRMLGNPADAEDLLQDIFLAAHRKLESFRGESALGTWLYRLAMNQILDHLRSRGARTGQMTDGMDDASLIADASAHRLGAAAVTRIDLERAIAELPEGCRAAFLLHDVEGLEHRRSRRCARDRRRDVEVAGAQGAAAPAGAARRDR